MFSPSRNREGYCETCDPAREKCDPARVSIRRQPRASRRRVCGSARETAVWALMAWGIRCIVARGFADIFRENCLQNGVLPLELGEGDHAAFAAPVVAADGSANR